MSLTTFRAWSVFCLGRWCAGKTRNPPEVRRPNARGCTRTIRWSSTTMKGFPWHRRPKASASKSVKGEGARCEKVEDIILGQPMPFNLLLLLKGRQVIRKGLYILRRIVVNPLISTARPARTVNQNGNVHSWLWSILTKYIFLEFFVTLNLIHRSSVQEGQVFLPRRPVFRTIAYED